MERQDLKGLAQLAAVIATAVLLPGCASVLETAREVNNATAASQQARMAVDGVKREVGAVAKVVAPESAAAQMQPATDAFGAPIVRLVRTERTERINPDGSTTVTERQIFSNGTSKERSFTEAPARRSAREAALEQLFAFNPSL